VENYTYDPNGNRLTLSKRDGVNIVTSIYDPLNREVKHYLHGGVDQNNPPVLGSDAVKGNDVGLTYDLAGRKTSALYASGQGLVQQYDAAGRPISEATNGLAVTYAYDASSNRSRMTWPDGYYAAYVYDGLNRLTQVQENGATSGAGLLAQFSYDPLSRRAGATLGDGSSASLAYDADSHLTSLAHAFPVSSYNLTFGTVTYNPAHQILGRPTSNPLYDFAGYVNTSRTSTANGLNQDATIAALSDGYDANGNETDDGTRKFTYDVDNRLTGVSNTSAATTVTYSYDPAGRLQQEQSTVSGSTTTTQFLYGGDKLLAEYSAGTLINRYVHGGGTDEPLVWYAGATTANRAWLHVDNQGSVIATSTATSVTPLSYGAYGEPNSWSGSRFRYTGQIILPAAQLYYYKARVYDPVAGRFLQTDPIGYRGDLNAYRFVNNDPENLSDSTGLVAYDCSKGVGSSNCNGKAMLKNGDTIKTKSGTIKITMAESGVSIPSQQTFRLTGQQAAFVKSGNAAAFWTSRAIVGDPIASAGLASLHPKDGVADYLFGGTSINNRLEAFSRVYAHRSADIGAIRLDLMRAHASAVLSDSSGVPGLLNPQQVAQYHFQVFSRYGLPSTTFGGTPMTGNPGESWVTAPIWCQGCDSH
jgi:RHS repeat-associated protein